MKLGKKRLQEVKLLISEGVSFEDIDEKYSFLTQHGASTENILTLLDNNICNFKQIVDRFKEIRDSGNWSCLYLLLQHSNLFDELIESDALINEDLNYLLNKIDKGYELRWLCKNDSLIKYILNEFLLDTYIVNNLNEPFKKDEWAKLHKIQTIFDCIDFHNENNEEILKLNEVNKKIYELNCFGFELTASQQSEIVELLKNNVKAQEMLIQIVDNNLQDQYDFEQLKKILTKDDDKKKLKMNF